MDISYSNQTHQNLLSSEDIVEIEQLNNYYFYAIDGLVNGNDAAAWADTFTDDGTFSIVDSSGTVIQQATGTDNLENLYETFPEVETTRHWNDNLIVQPTVTGAEAESYILAMDIASTPATIERTGVYTDQLLRINGSWKFQNRTLTLDPVEPFSQTTGAELSQPKDFNNFGISQNISPLTFEQTPDIFSQNFNSEAFGENLEI